MENNHNSKWGTYLPIVAYVLLIAVNIPKLIAMLTDSLKAPSWENLRSFILALFFSILFFLLLYYYAKRKRKSILTFVNTAAKNKVYNYSLFVIKFILIYLLFYYIFSNFLTNQVFVLGGKYFPNLLQGIWYTISISFCSILLGTLIGAIASYFLTSYEDFSFTKVVVNIAVYVMLSIPALVLIQLIYYTGNINSVFLVSVVALAINLSPFVSKILTSSLNNIPIDQVNSGKAFGFSKYEIAKKIKLPFIVKHSLQSLLVEYYTTIKLSSLVGTIGMLESFHTTQDIVKETQDPISGYILLSICYVFLVIPFAVLADFIEKKIRTNNNQS